MSEEDFVCTIVPKPIGEWVSEEKKDEADCPPCLMAPLSSYYLGALEAGGESRLAGELKSLFDEGNVLTIAQKLDTIKSDVGEALRKQLINLDCFAQTFKQDDASR